MSARDVGGWLPEATTKNRDLHGGHGELNPLIDSSGGNSASWVRARALRSTGEEGGDREVAADCHTSGCHETRDSRLSADQLHAHASDQGGHVCQRGRGGLAGHEMELHGADTRNDVTCSGREGDPDGWGVCRWVSLWLTD